MLDAAAWPCGALGFARRSPCCSCRVWPYLGRLAAGFWRATRNSIGVAPVGAVSRSDRLGRVRARLAPTVLVRTVVRAAGVGYAMPGTVLAVGLLSPSPPSKPRRAGCARPSDLERDACSRA